MDSRRPPLPPFTMDTAIEKVRLAEDGWNSRDPGKVALAYTVDSYRRNRTEFIQGREAIAAFLKRKWERELNYRLIKELRGFRENRMAVRFAYELSPRRSVRGQAEGRDRSSIVLPRQKPTYASSSCRISSSMRCISLASIPGLPSTRIPNESCAC
jgi:nuclear transport factor 2 (NTF2) superfamily protein